MTQKKRPRERSATGRSDPGLGAPVGSVGVPGRLGPKALFENFSWAMTDPPADLELVFKMLIRLGSPMARTPIVGADVADGVVDASWPEIKAGEGVSSK